MYSLHKIFNPAIFQGTFDKSNYFEGWYFKHVSASAESAFTVIPGISLSSDSHAFIQFSEGKEGNSEYFRYDLSDFHSDNKRFLIKTGDSEFSSSGINLSLKNKNISIRGKIDYSNMVILHQKLLSPGIMGWYSYVPGMECNHGVLSVTHSLSGSILVNDREKNFSGGKGYIEKDWGISFPESWMWLQCNNFGNEDLSVMISLAKIPWRGKFFMGFVAFIHFNGRTEIFATYNRARILYLKKIDDRRTEILIERGKKKLMAFITRKDIYALKAPVMGNMINMIKESISSEVQIEYSEGMKTIFSGHGIRAGYEETENIFRYF